MELTLKTIQTKEIGTFTDGELGDAHALINEQKKKWELLENKVKDEIKKRYNETSTTAYGNTKIVIQNRKMFDKDKFDAEATEEEKNIQLALSEYESEFAGIQKKYQIQNQIITIR